MWLSTNVCRRGSTSSTTNVVLSMVTSASSQCLPMLPWSGNSLVSSTRMPSLTALLPSQPTLPSTTLQRWSKEDHTRHTNGEVDEKFVVPYHTLCMICYCHNYVLVWCRSADMWGLGVLIYEVYNGEMRQTSDLRNTSKVLT